MIKINVKRNQEFVVHTLQTSFHNEKTTTVRIMQVSSDRGIPVKFQKTCPLHWKCWSCLRVGVYKGKGVPWPFLVMETALQKIPVVKIYCLTVYCL